MPTKSRRMKPRNSLLYPIIGLVILIAVPLTLALYYVSDHSLKDAIDSEKELTLEHSMAMMMDLLYQQRVTIERSTNPLKTSSRIIQGVVAASGPDGDTSSLEANMLTLVPSLSVDVVQITDSELRLLYSLHQPERIGERLESIALGF